jgi:hypothetical protein
LAADRSSSLVSEYADTLSGKLDQIVEITAAEVDPTISFIKASLRNESEE